MFYIEFISHILKVLQNIFNAIMENMFSGAAGNSNEDEMNAAQEHGINNRNADFEHQIANDNAPLSLVALLRQVSSLTNDATCLVSTTTPSTSTLLPAAAAAVMSTPTEETVLMTATASAVTPATVTRSTMELTSPIWATGLSVSPPPPPSSPPPLTTPLQQPFASASTSMSTSTTSFPMMAGSVRSSSPIGLNINSSFSPRRMLAPIGAERAMRMALREQQAYSYFSAESGDQERSSAGQQQRIVSACPSNRSNQYNGDNNFSDDEFQHRIADYIDSLWRIRPSEDEQTPSETSMNWDIWFRSRNIEGHNPFLLEMQRCFRNEISVADALWNCMALCTDARRNAYLVTHGLTYEYFPMQMSNKTDNRFDIITSQTKPATFNNTNVSQDSLFGVSNYMERQEHCCNVSLQPECPPDTEVVFTSSQHSVDRSVNSFAEDHSEYEPLSTDHGEPFATSVDSLESSEAEDFIQFGSVTVPLLVELGYFEHEGAAHSPLSAVTAAMAAMVSPLSSASSGILLEAPTSTSSLICLTPSSAMMAHQSARHPNFSGIAKEPLVSSMENIINNMTMNPNTNGHEHIDRNRNFELHDLQLRPDGGTIGDRIPIAGCNFGSKYTSNYYSEEHREQLHEQQNQQYQQQQHNQEQKQPQHEQQQQHQYELQQQYKQHQYEQPQREQEQYQQNQQQLQRQHHHHQQQLQQLQQQQERQQQHRQLHRNDRHGLQHAVATATTTATTITGTGTPTAATAATTMGYDDSSMMSLSPFYYYYLHPNSLFNYICFYEYQRQLALHYQYLLMQHIQQMLPTPQHQEQFMQQLLQYQTHLQQQIQQHLQMRLQQHQQLQQLQQNQYQNPHQYQHSHLHPHPHSHSHSYSHSNPHAHQQHQQQLQLQQQLQHQQLNQQQPHVQQLQQQLARCNASATSLLATSASTTSTTSTTTITTTTTTITTSTITTALTTTTATATTTTTTTTTATPMITSTAATVEHMPDTSSASSINQLHPRSVAVQQMLQQIHAQPQVYQQQHGSGANIYENLLYAQLVRQQTIAGLTASPLQRQQLQQKQQSDQQQYQQYQHQLQQQRQQQCQQYLQESLQNQQQQLEQQLEQKSEQHNTDTCSSVTSPRLLASSALSFNLNTDSSMLSQLRDIMPAMRRAQHYVEPRQFNMPRQQQYQEQQQLRQNQNCDNGCIYNANSNLNNNNNNDNNNNSIHLGNGTNRYNTNNPNDEVFTYNNIVEHDVDEKISTQQEKQ